MKKSDVKLVGLVAGGVMLAGWLMAQFSDAPVISQARNGYRS